MAVDDEMDRDELEAAVSERFEHLYGDTIRWEVDGGREHLARDLENFDEDTLREMLDFSDEDFEDLADFTEDDAPDWLLEMGWYDDDGDWHNPFWYH